MRKASKHEFKVGDCVRIIQGDYSYTKRYLGWIGKIYDARGMFLVNFTNTELSKADEDNPDKIGAFHPNELEFLDINIVPPKAVSDLANI